MLSFATPPLLIGLLLVPAIWWLHRGGPRRLGIPVPSLVLWRRAVAESAVTGRRRPPDPAWRRRALIAALLVVAFAGPQWPMRQGRVTVWIDDSLSMLARETRGSRLEEGLARVRSALADARAGEIELRTLSEPWRSVGALDEAAVATIVAAAGRKEPAAPPAALLRSDTQHWLLTDGADAAVLDWPHGYAPDRVFQVARASRNVGLERASARRDLGDPRRHALLFKITNGGVATETRELVIAAGSGEVARSLHRVDAGGSVVVQATIPASNTVRATLEPADELPADDEIALDLAPLAPRRITADPRCSRALLAALRAHPGVTLVPQETGRAEVAVTCGESAGPRGAAQLRVLPDQLPSRLRGPLQWSSSVPEPDRARIDPEGLQTAGRIDPRPGDTVLLSAGDDPLVVKRAGTPAMLETSLDFSSAAAARQPETALLAAFLLEQLLGARLLGARLLDDVVLVDRGPSAVRVVPVRSLATAATPAPSAAMRVQNLARHVLFATLLLLTWEFVAVIRQWRRVREHTRALLTLALQGSAIAVLTATVLGHSWLDPRAKPLVRLLVDRSDSMPRAATDAAVAQVVQAVDEANGHDPQLIQFAGRPGVAETDLRPSSTNVERALDVALVAQAARPGSAIVVVSDGHQNSGDASRALQAVHEAGLPVQWLAVGRPAPATRIVDVLAPGHAQAGQPIHVDVWLAGRLDVPLRVTATAHSPDGGAQTATGQPDGDGRATLEFAANTGGPLLVDVAVELDTSGDVLDARKDAAAIDVTERASLLYLQGSPGPLARSLAEGGWPVDVVAAFQADAYADRLGGYRAVVLDDVAVEDAGARFWSALVSGVRDRGLGLLVLGGERSFTSGAYRQSQLESVLPVISEPAALDQPASVVFAVDKSGSMGQGSGGVDRFRLAQRAVLDAAGGLTGRDSLGLVVFDVEPRVLIPLGPAADTKPALERDWLATPRGGTRLAPALDAAISELERSGAVRRILVLVTDGFVDDTPLEAVRTRLARARIETIALAVGPDADLQALGRLVDPGSDRVVRVTEAAELPRTMSSELERRRARVERGTIKSLQVHPLPFLPGSLGDWPAIAAYSVTRTRPQATVAVRSERGDPLVALQTSGQGRVAAVTSGLGQWTPGWTRWTQWPRLVGGLAGWVSGTPRDGALGVAVTDLADGLRIDVDLRDATGWADPAGTTLRLTTPSGETRPVASRYVAPGRLQAVVGDDAPGLYTVAASTAFGTQRLLHLRRNPAEEDSWGTSPAIDEWKRAGLVRDWNPAALAKPRSETARRLDVDRSLLALALALFLAGVLLDRGRLVFNRWQRQAGRRSSPAPASGSHHQTG